jgi:hypothetical protein
MIEIFLIAETKIDQSFLALAQKVIHRSISIELDRKNMPFGDLASYISILGEAHEAGSDPIVSQREAGCLLQHISISFLVVSTKEALYEIATQTSLSFLTVECNEVYETAIVSGTLEQLRTEIINGCSTTASLPNRYFANKTLILLEKAGLGRVFDTFSKKVSKDGTFLLTYKGT